jgi:GrpB-like predicted nucleotidyltransferase (UPF0157 family)
MSIHLNLIGIMRTFRGVDCSGAISSQVMDLYTYFFSRLNEIQDLPEVSRILRYESRIGEELSIFIGVEVRKPPMEAHSRPQIEQTKIHSHGKLPKIPHGMTGWCIDDQNIQILEPYPEPESIQFEPIQWIWLNGCDLNPPRVIGDFRDKISNTIWTLTANAALNLSPSRDDDKILLREYNPEWPVLYEQCAARLKSIFGPNIRIEHYGSTSIPGMAAKPVIDILMEIPSVEEARRRTISRFNSPVWEYWQYWDHMAFIRRDERTGVRTHHIHVAPKDHKIWRGLIFRDYLRSHMDIAREYERLKTELAIKFNQDREGYTEAKGEFVRRVLSDINDY